MRIFQIGVVAAVGLAGSAALAAAQAPERTDKIVYQRTPQTEAIGPYRRAYRSECVKYEPVGYCECITAGFAQSLNANELTMARLRLPADHAATPRARAHAQSALDRAAQGLGFAAPGDRARLFSRIDALESDLQTTCGKP